MSFDQVTEVAKALAVKQVCVSNDVLEKIRGELRGLEFRNPYGTLQKGDNGRKRICALLEYVAREEEDISIPLDQLALVAYMKEADFKKFHRKLGQFRILKPTKAQESNKTSSIPSLAMKLGAYVADSNGVAFRAQRLWGDLARFYRKNKHQMKDMVQDARMYEAACFYIVATTQEGRCGDDIEEKQLQLSTIANVLGGESSLEEFAQVEGHVRQLVGEMRESEQKEKDNVVGGLHETTNSSSSSSSQKRKTNRESLSNSNVSTQPKKAVGRSTKRTKRTGPGESLDQEEDQCSALKSMMDSVTNDSYGESTVAATEPDASYSRKFEKGRHLIVSRAIQLANIEIKSSAVVVSDVPRDQALEHAVRSILKLRGY